MTRHIMMVPMALLLISSYGIAALPLARCAFVVPPCAVSPADGDRSLGGRFRRSGAAAIGAPPPALGAASGDEDDRDEDDRKRSPKQPRGDDAERRYREMMEEQDDSPSKEKSPLYLFFDALEMTFSYSFQFLGNLLFLGIFLNLCGYGYYFDSKKGLQFDTLANMREMVQFQDAAKKMQQQVELRPTSSLPE